jgi:hypothetical protein
LNFELKGRRSDRQNRTDSQTDGHLGFVDTRRARKTASKRRRTRQILNFFVGVCWGKKGCGACWVCGLGYIERESKEEGVLDLELVVIRSAAWGHTHVKKIQNCKEILRILSAGTS